MTARSRAQSAPPGTQLRGDVSLTSMLDYADQRSPVLDVARSTRSRAAAVRVANDILLPSDPDLSFSTGPRMGRTATGLDIGASLMQEIRVAGERGLRMTAAKRFGELTDAEIEQVRWSVHCDVHAAFNRALVEQARAKLAERVVGFQEEVLRVVERQIAAGETAPLTLRIAQAEVAQAEQVLVAANQAYYVSRIRLAQLAGWPIADLPTPAGVIDSPLDPPAAETLGKLAREHLPSLRTGVARMREAEARRLVANREVAPRPSVGVQYQREGNAGPEGAYNIVQGAISLPIPTFNRNQGTRAQARADVTVAEAELGATRRLLEGQIEEARSEVAAAAARTRAYGTEIVPRFEENLTMLRRSFELGEVDILGLSVGRERFLRIQSDSLTAQLDYFVALAGLERVVGVDLRRDEDHEEQVR